MKPVFALCPTRACLSASVEDAKLGQAGGSFQACNGSFVPANGSLLAVRGDLGRGRFALNFRREAPCLPASATRPCLR